VRELIVLVVIGLGTYLMRAAFLVGSRPAPARLARVLPHVGPAVLAAITAPALLAPRGTMVPVDTVTAALAAAVAWVLWWRTRSLPVALFGGLILSWLTGWVLS
jgi:branched-subunit amino acid transport protein